MPPDLATMIERVAALRVRIQGRTATEALLAEIEDTLTEGYAHALTGDAWSMRSEQRLHDLINDAELPIRARELRALATEHGRFQHDVVALRRELAELREDRDRLHARSGSHATTG